MSQMVQENMIIITLRATNSAALDLRHGGKEEIMQISPSSNVSKLLYLFVAIEMNTREHWFWVSSDHRECWKSKKAFAFVLDTLRRIAFEI